MEGMVEMKNLLMRFATAAIVAFMIICGVKALNYVLVDDTSSYTRIMEHEFYHQENIDVLCLGASHCQKGINPVIVSEKIGKNVFNAASSSQKPDASYALIKEAIRRYDVEEIYLEISTSVAQSTGNYEDRTDLTSTYLISDYMKPSINKALLLLGASSSEHYMNGFFPARRNWASVLDFQYIGTLLEKKDSDGYANYEYDSVKHRHEWYAGNGYVAGDEVVNEHEQYTADGTESVNINNISEDWKNSILSIIDYCNKHDVKITLYDSPVSCFQLSAQGNYDEYIAFVHDLVNEKNVEYAEFNLLKDEYLPCVQSDYRDGHHFNVYGAEKFSAFFAEYINGNVPKAAYYGSITEKLQDIAPDYYGISYEDDDEGQIRKIRLVSNRPGYFEYKVEIVRDDETTTLQDFAINSELHILADPETGSMPDIIVTYRVAGSDDEGIKVVY